MRTAKAKRWVIIVVVMAAGIGAALPQPPQQAPAKEPVMQPILQMKRLTPVLAVEAIEPVIPFWVDRLGFQKTIEVPEGDKLGFVALEKDGIQVMYQTWASIEKDVAAMAKERRGPTFLFIEIQGFDEIRKRLEGAPTVVADRKTFYGARETIVRDPAGHVVTFAEFTAAN